MTVEVQTGSTKSASGLSLVSLEFDSASGERVLLLMQIHASAQDAKTLEKECVTVIQNSLLETEGSASERFDGTLKEINGLLKGLFVSRVVEDIHAIIGIISADNMLYVSHAGRAEAYIVRSGAASQITEYTKGKPTPAFVHIANGPIEARDVIIFSTQRLLRTVTPAQLAQYSQRGDQLLEELTMALEAEKERAALAVIRVMGKKATESIQTLSQRTPRRREAHRRPARTQNVKATASVLLSKIGSLFSSIRVPDRLLALPGKLLSDLKNPKRKKRTHLFILAGAVAVFLIVWAVINLSTFSQRNQSRAELQELMTQIDEEIHTAETRHLTGEIDEANAILQRAEDRAKSVMDNESGLFRMEALDLLDRIRLKQEEINNIVRLSPRIIVNLSAKNPDILAQGLIGVKDGELVVYDRQDIYRVLLNSVDEPERLSDEDLILNGTFFPRMQTTVFQMDHSSVIEIISGQTTTMKTEDPAGWINGNAIETYLRFLYVLSPENNQIYKYERLSNRYAPPAEYNVDGDITGGKDMAIDGNVFVLKEGGEVVKLFRGEAKPFTIRHMPEGALSNATKIFKAAEGNLYFLDPVRARVVVATDGGATGESSYVKQFILEEEQIGELKDLYVDPDELRLYVLDEKRVYAIDLGTR
ncbi:MAG: hypothetical protein WCX61_04785 [Candidatus Peribacteraceae bacterium]